jgi:hypothetical protein
MYTVTHSATLIVLDRNGKAAFIITGLASQHPGLRGIAQDVNTLPSIVLFKYSVPEMFLSHQNAPFARRR